MERTFACVSVSVKQSDGKVLKLDIPHYLHIHLVQLANNASITVSQYIESIIFNKSKNPVGWKKFEPQAEALLMIYEFCFRDSESTIQVLNNLRKQA